MSDRRIYLRLPPKSADRLDRLVEITEAISVLEVFKDALRYYEQLVLKREINESLVGALEDDV